MTVLIQARQILLWVALGSALTALLFALLPALLPGLFSWMLTSLTMAVPVLLAITPLAQGLGAYGFRAHDRASGARTKGGGVAFIAAFAWVAAMGTIALASLSGPGALVPVMLIAFPAALIGFVLQIIALVQMRGAVWPIRFGAR